MDYNALANIKTGYQKQQEKEQKTVNADISEINEVINSLDEEKMKQLHITLDGKYSSYIPNWGQSAYNYNVEFGFDYNYLGEDALIHNLTLFKAKLQGYLCGFSIIDKSSLPTNNISVNVQNTNEIVVNITFEQAKQSVEDMPGLTEDDTQIIINKIDELEQISKENTTKKKKWEKVKPILSFALDKGADVGIMIMGLILQMKLGM